MEIKSNSKYTRLFLCHPCHDCNLMLSDVEYNLLTYLTLAFDHNQLHYRTTFC